MKAQTKALVASVVVIALALSAVSGITYSWFSDTETSEITVTTGNIDLDAQYKDVKVSSYGDSEAKSVTVNVGSEDSTTTATTLGGTVKATATSQVSETSAYKGLAIEFKNAAPGDKVTFSMYVTLQNSIYVTYAQSIIKDSNAPFTITGFVEKDVKDATIRSSPTDMIGSSTTFAEVTIEFDQDAAVEDYGNKQYTIILAVQAIQQNVELPDIAATETISLASGTIGAEKQLSVQSTESGASITVTLPATTAKKSSETSTSSSVSVTAKALTKSDNASEQAVTASVGGQFLAGVEISRSMNIEPGTDGSTQQYFKIAMKVGYLTSEQQTGLKVYHDGEEVQSTEAENEEYYHYDSETGTITIYALSFSPFVVIDGCQAKIGSTSYATLGSAIAAAVDGQTVTLLKDLDAADALTISGKSISLDLNGKEVTFTGITSEKGTDSEFTGNITITNGAKLYVTGATGSKIVFSETFGFKVIGTLVVDGDAEFEMTKADQKTDEDKNVIVCMALTGSNPSVTINSGTFKGLSGGSVVYSKYGGSVDIYGGQFSGTAADNKSGWLLNQNNSSFGTITVYGGTFTNYDPSTGDDASKNGNTAKTFVASGYLVASSTDSDDTIYTVVPSNISLTVDGTTEYYMAIKDAVDALNEKTGYNSAELKFLKDYTSNSALVLNNGKSVTITGSSKFTVTDVFWKITSGNVKFVNLEFVTSKNPTNSEAQHIISIPAGSTAAVTVSGCDFMSGSTYNNDQQTGTIGAIYTEGGSSLDVSDSTFALASWVNVKEKKKHALELNSIDSVELKGNTFTGISRPINIKGVSSVVSSSNVFDMPVTDSSVKDGKVLKVYSLNGTMTKFDISGDEIKWKDVKDVSQYEVYINTSVTVTGTFVSDKDVYVEKATGSDPKVYFTVSGNAKINGSLTADSDNVKLGTANSSIEISEKMTVSPSTDLTGYNVIETEQSGTYKYKYFLESTPES